MQLLFQGSLFRFSSKCFKEHGTIARKPGSGLTLKLSPTILQLIESAMREDDETTATQLQAKLTAHGCYVSLTTILHNRRQLGWIYRGSAYCQLIRNENKQKQLEWARANHNNNFDDVIWSDESSIVTDDTAAERRGKSPRPKPQPKHPTKVHVWTGISKKGATGICIFEETMDSILYCEILRRTLCLS